MLGGVAFARIDLILHVLALLIVDLQRAAVWRHHLDLQFAVGAIKFAIGRVIGNSVLVADVARDVAENLRVFRLKTRLIETSPRHFGEGLHFIVGLQIIHLGDWNAGSTGSTGATVHFAVFPDDPAGTDGKNRDVFC